MFDFKKFLANLTTAPGVYQMLDHNAEILYVGKAKNLKKRISSYFRARVDHPKTKALVKQIADIRILITQDENEALLLENNLIKQYRPRYNILFRDDKSYPYLIFSQHIYPRLDILRSQKTPQTEYFGPFSNSFAVRQTLQLIEKLFLLRNCSDNFFAHRTRPCLQYQIKRCSAPCVQLISREDYQRAVQNAKLFLQGKNKMVIAALTTEMDDAAERLDFEQAKYYRDQIKMLRQIESEQVIQNAHGDFDVIAFFCQEQWLSIQLLMIRQGKIIGNHVYFHEQTSASSIEEMLSYFIAHYYLNARHTLPKEIFIPQKIADQNWLSNAFSRAAQHKVLIKIAARGIPYNLMQSATHNAREVLRAKLAEHSSQKKRLHDLERALDLPPDSIQRMECFDISHTFGEATVASCVVFDQEGPDKKSYRIFNIKEVTKGDDFAAMRQVLTRRYSAAKPQDELLPDLIIVDGGKGQLQQAIEVLAGYGLDNIMILGIAKGVTRKAGFETIWRAGQEKPLQLDTHAPAMHLLQHIRDEAHRFAISKHRAKRGKSSTTSTLEDIPGVGSKKRQALLKHFGGWQGLQSASINALSKAPGIGLRLAKQIHQFLAEHG